MMRVLGLCWSSGAGMLSPDITIPRSWGSCHQVSGLTDLLAFGISGRILSCFVPPIKSLATRMIPQYHTLTHGTAYDTILGDGYIRMMYRVSANLYKEITHYA